jgi:hypothetical protein
MWGSMPLMTVSAAIIIVLHSAEVVHVSPWVMIILEKLNTRCTDEHPTTFPRCVLRNHYNTIQWFYLACNVSTEISPPVWASHTPRSLLLCLMSSSHHSCTHTTPRLSHCSFTEHPSGSAITASPHNRWYIKTRLYHILCRVVPI